MGKITRIAPTVRIFGNKQKSKSVEIISSKEYSLDNEMARFYKKEILPSLRLAGKRLSLLLLVSICLCSCTIGGGDEDTKPVSNEVKTIRRSIMQSDGVRFVVNLSTIDSIHFTYDSAVYVTDGVNSEKLSFHFTETKLMPKNSLGRDVTELMFGK